jgi:hypothetical protein
MLLVAFPRMIQGTFLSRREEEENPSLYFNTDHIKRELEEFFSNPYANKDLSLHNFPYFLVLYYEEFISTTFASGDED